MLNQLEFHKDLREMLCVRSKDLTVRRKAGPVQCVVILRMHHDKIVNFVGAKKRDNDTYDPENPPFS